MSRIFAPLLFLLSLAFIECLHHNNGINNCINIYDTVNIASRVDDENKAEYVHSLAFCVSKYGDIYIGGTYSGKIRFGSGSNIIISESPSYSYNSAFLMEYDFNNGLQNLSTWSDNYVLGHIVKIMLIADTMPVVFGNLCSDIDNIYFLKVMDNNRETICNWESANPYNQLFFDFAIKDNADNIYMVGAYNISDMGINYEYYPNESSMISLNKDCLQQSIKSWGGPEYNVATKIAIAADGSIYVLGSSDQKLVLGENEDLVALRKQEDTCQARYSYLIKFDENGNPQKVLNWQAELIDIATWNNSVFLTGHFNGIKNFEPGWNDIEYASSGLSDIILLKMNPDSEVSWVKCVGGVGEDKANDIAISRNGTIYITGNYTGTINIKENYCQKLIRSRGKKDILLLKYYSSGEMICASSIGGKNDEQGIINIDYHDNVYLLATYQGPVYFDKEERPIINISEKQYGTMLIKFK